MFDLIEKNQSQSHEQIFTALKAIDPESEYVLVRKKPDEHGGFAWVQSWHHDLDGAMRSFKYMATKIRSTYDAADPKGQKVMMSIDHHLETVRKLKTDLFDRIFRVP